MAVRVMAHVIRTALPMAFLLSSAGLLAQDDPTPSPTPTATPVERIEGVPDDFSLEPPPETVLRNRTEPTIQPLPQPRGTPTPTQRSSQPAIVVPQVAPTAQPTTRSFPVPQERQVQQRSGEALSPQPTTSPEQRAEATSAPQGESQPGFATLPERSDVQSQPSVGTSPGNTAQRPVFSLALIASLLGGLAVLIGGVLVFMWFRRRAEPGFAVERIEPYRPEPEANAPAKPQPKPQPTPEPEPALPPPSGLVHAQPAPAANPGGFVTSSIAARPRRETSAPQQSPRRYTSSDGRIVTSLSRRPGND